MLKKITRFTALISITALLLGLPASAKSVGYTYNSWGESVSAPNTHECAEVFSGTDISGKAFEKPADIFYDEKNDELIILDSNRLVITDGNFTFKKEITRFISEKGEETLETPSGVFADKDGVVYIADTGHNRVLMLDRAANPDVSPNVIDILTYTNLEIDTKELPFRPTKVIKDAPGNIYVLSTGFYLGAIVFDSGKNFVGFYGSNRVESTLDVLADMFWRNFMSRTARESMANYVPVEYTSFDIDREGFIYTCTSTNQTGVEQVRKLNTTGSNILPGRTLGNNVNTAVFGDIEAAYGSISKNFTDITVDADGFIYLADQALRKGYWYNADGELIGTFGARGDVKGAFTSVTAVETIGDRVLVLDAEGGMISVFARTEFGNKIANALMLYNDGLYQEAMAPWQEVVAMSSNYQLAYVSMGKAYYSAKDYQKAMEYFKLSYNRQGYSDAYKEYRKAGIRNNAAWFVPLIAVLLLAFWLLWRKRGKLSGWYDNKSPLYKQRVTKLTYGFRTMIRISDNFEELKAGKESSLPVAVGLLVTFFAVCIADARYKGFIFNLEKAADFNVLILLASTVGLLLLWCTCNWAVTTLLEGKGKLRHIFMVSVYSLMPMMFAMLVNIGFSWVATIDEGIFLTWILCFGILWTGVMMVKGLSEIHEYSGGKIVMSVALTVCAMAAVVFLGILMFSLVSQLVSFIRSIFIEVSFRYF